MKKDAIFITGATGYLGKRLIKILVDEGLQVTALVRAQSVHKLPQGCTSVIANPFDWTTYVDSVPAGCIFIHLLGVSHPGPKKKKLFFSIDLVSLGESVKAAVEARAKHFVYLSVAQYPTKMMADYQEARRQGEQLLTASGLPATFVRPWYVIGPGHYWPLLFYPFFKVLEVIPATAAAARALAVVPLSKMLLTLKQVILGPPPNTIGIIEVADIKRVRS